MCLIGQHPPFSSPRQQYNQATLMLILLLWLSITAAIRVDLVKTVDPEWLRSIVLDLSNVLEGIKNEEVSAKRAWSLMISHPKYPFLQKKGQSNLLCLVLSQISAKLMEDERVKLVLFELDLYRIPKRQVQCILYPASSNPQFFEKYQKFIDKLPILSNAKEWKHVINAWMRLKNPLERTRLIESAKGLTTGTDQISLLGQFCAMDEMKHQVSEEFITLLPVFKVVEGRDILERAETSNPCREFLGRHGSETFKQLLSDTKKATKGKLPKIIMSEDKFNLALANILPVEKYLKLIKYNISAGNIGSLFRFIDTSDLLLKKDLDTNEAIMIAACLVNSKVPTELFTLYFQRAGRLIQADASKYNQFLSEVLLNSTMFDHPIFFKWYIELTSLEPTLLEKEIVSIPLWDAIMKPKFNNGPIDLSTIPDSTNNIALLELILAKTKCITKQPIVEPRKCEALKSLVRRSDISIEEFLKHGYWRLASLTDYTSKQLRGYISGNDHSIAAIGWALSCLSSLGVKEANNLMQSNNLGVRALVYLFAKFKKIAKVCRSPHGSLQTIPLMELEEILERTNSENQSIFNPSEKYLIIKSLFSLMTDVSLDDLTFVAWIETPIDQIFNKLVNTYCGRWEGVQPAILAI